MEAKVVDGKDVPVQALGGGTSRKALAYSEQMTQAKLRREREWSDDREEESSSPYEPCYRDGSVKHECWRGDE